MKILRTLITALAIGLAAAAPVALSAADDAAYQAEFQAQRPSVKVLTGGVEIDNPSTDAVDVTVYAITGTLVKHIQVAPGDKVTLDLSAGYYIVKVDRYSTRVAVK